MSHVSWPTVQKSKADGGLQIRNLATLNKAYWLKNSWTSIMESEKLWVQVLRSKYKFTSDDASSPIALRNAFVYWKSICANWEVLKLNIVWSVGDGNTLINKSVSYFVNNAGGWNLSCFDFLLPNMVNLRIAATMPPAPNHSVDHPCCTITFWEVLAKINLSNSQL
ncbi:hypothetical protein ACFE04_003098 [Oxalis oulophora]